MGGAVESHTLALDNTITTIQDLKITPGFTDGATMSDLTISFSNEADASTFDVLRYTEFFVGPDPTLSTKSNVIEGAVVLANDGNITVKGANLESVYALTGQKVAATNLSSGVYLVRISKDDKVATVKVAF
ncbi:T9SS type A sorting domain-containing protein [Flavivirga algicola]|uniref:T9SS type A sorting domain-containing protein n=1 Tax=Flavivirga algicola TaxID=2729136 RepID=A0ABX1RTK0_9FLAO|nr:T9SS type A sorting domain-containing protein [Flavivirga algicola]NMH86882.1 T9SS type A sorting domain-containing protein [Flavivirga algicola]